MIHATVIEQIWLVFALAASFVVVFNLFDAYANLNYLDGTGQNGRRRMLALQHIRSELFRLALCTAKVVVAGIAITTPQPSLEASVVGWTVTSFVILIWSVLDAKTRHTLRVYRAESGGRRSTDQQTERIGDASERRQ